MTNHANACIFLGYSENRKGYRLYNQSKRKVIHSRDVRFDEQLRGTEEENPSTEEENPPGPVMFEKEYSESAVKNYQQTRLMYIRIQPQNKQPLNLLSEDQQESLENQIVLESG